MTRIAPCANRRIGIKKIVSEHFIHALVKTDVKIKLAMGMLVSASGALFAQITASPALPELSETNLPPITNLPPANLTDTNRVFNFALPPHHFPMSPQPADTPAAPGVYVTRPYSCMVKVPGVQPDNCIIPVTPGPDSMPNRKPKLEFVPVPPPGGM